MLPDSRHTPKLLLTMADRKSIFIAYQYMNVDATITAGSTLLLSAVDPPVMLLLLFCPLLPPVLELLLPPLLCRTAVTHAWAYWRTEKAMMQHTACNTQAPTQQQQTDPQYE